MKFISATIAAISLTLSAAVQQNSDMYYHEKPSLGASMWHFSPDGLSIYSPNGNLLKSHRKASLCPRYMSRGQWREDCYYYTYASDGHKYVWAGSFAGGHHIEAFDIDTGDYAGWKPTCSTPLDLEYHPSREEMWLRCAQSTGDFEGEIQTFSSNSLSQDIDLIHLNDTRRPYGRIAIHSSMGPYGIVTAYDQNYLSILDLSSKTVKEKIQIPKAHGSYDVTYSPVNEHIFARARVCCSCGFDGADKATCGGSYGSTVIQQVTVQTGPFANPLPQNGTCGGSCEGTNADTIGVVEFDTVSKTFIAEHNIKAGTGFGADPVASPDGKFVMLMGNDGGKYVRLIKPGLNGQASSVLTDIEVDFKNGVPGKTAISDMAFIQDANRNLLVLASTADNDVAIIDLDNGYAMKKIALTAAEESTDTRSRKIEWAVGTDYVWISGGEATEVYIMEISGGIETARISKTLTGAASGEFLFTNNYERLRAEMATKKMMDDMAAASTSDKSASVSASASASDDSHDSHDDHMKISETEKENIVQEVTSNIRANSNLLRNESDDDGNSDNMNPIAISALIIGAVALVTSSVLMIYTFSQSKPEESTDIAGDKSLSSNLKVN